MVDKKCVMEGCIVISLKIEAQLKIKCVTYIQFIKNPTMMKNSLEMGKTTFYREDGVVLG